MPQSTAKVEPTDFFGDMCVILPGGKGVALMSTVALRGLRRRFPLKNISVLCWHPYLLEGLPYVDHVYFPFASGVFSSAIADRTIVDLTTNVNYLPQRRKLHIIDVLCMIAGVENDGQGPDLIITEDVELQADAFLQKHHLGSDPFFVIHPKSSTPNKDWCQGQWKELVDLLLRHGPCLQVGGDPSIHPEIMPISKEGMMQFALLPKAAVCICVDSLFLHAAVACGVNRCCVLLGSSDPAAVYYPQYTYLYQEVAECQPCGRPYIQYDISFDSEGKPVTNERGQYVRWVCPDRRCFDWLRAGYVYEEVLRLMKNVPV